MNNVIINIATLVFLVTLTINITASVWGLFDGDIIKKIQYNVAFLGLLQGLFWVFQPTNPVHEARTFLILLVAGVFGAITLDSDARRGNETQDEVIQLVVEVSEKLLEIEQKIDRKD